MAVIIGAITYGGIGGHNNIAYWGDIDGFDPDTYLDYGEYEGLPALQADVVHVMPSANGESVLAAVTGSYYDDYYNRIHITPNPLEMGNLLSDQIRQVYVWNAYTSSQLLSVFSELNTDGIEIQEPAATPTTFTALDERIYTLNVSTSGPPAIGATLSFTFPDGVHSMGVTGTRVVLWKWLPDGEYTENIEFYTHILKTRQGEQRISMREAPRQIFKQKFTKTEQEFSQIKTAGKNWVARLWGVPVWGEQSKVSPSAGAMSIEFDTANADYRDGGLLALWESSDKVAAVEIATVRADGIDLVYPLAESWTNALVMPLRLARITDGINITRNGAGIQELSTTFKVTDNIDLSESNYTQYQGYDVFTDENVLLGGLSERITVPVQEFDNGSGPIVVETLQDFTEFNQSLGRVMVGSEVWEMRKWLHSRSGKQKAFYLPTWNNDFELVEDVNEFDTLLKVKNTQASLFSSVPFDIMLKFKDGSVMYRRVSAVTEYPTYEALTIDTAVGIVEMADVVMFSKLNLCRLNADSIELKHTSNILAKTTIPITEVPA